MNDPLPIGIFDSGVGGLTVARSVLTAIPGQPVHYLGDTANAPYGPLPAEQVRRHAMATAARLVDAGVSMLVVACNTAAAAGVPQLCAQRFGLPVVEVVTPAVQRAAAATVTGQVGVIGTIGTVASGAYPAAFAQLAGDRVTVHAQPCPSFVDFVERGITSGRQLGGLAAAYLEPLRRKDIDTLVLGCTHYPLLAPLIGSVMGESVTLVDSGAECAAAVAAALAARGLLSLPPDPGGDQAAHRPRHRFEATGDPAAFRRLASRFLGRAIDSWA